MHLIWANLGFDGMVPAVTDCDLRLELGQMAEDAQILHGVGQ